MLKCLRLDWNEIFFLRDNRLNLCCGQSKIVFGWNFSLILGNLWIFAGFAGNCQFQIEAKKVFWRRFEYLQFDFKPNGEGQIWPSAPQLVRFTQIHKKHIYQAFPLTINCTKI